MADDAKKPDDKPNPIEDIRKGLGLFFRAAKTTIDQFPADKLEDAILQGAKEVGRAVENVARSVEEQVRGAAHATKKDGTPADAAKAEAASEEPTGVRVDASADAPKTDPEPEKKADSGDAKPDAPTKT